MPEITLYVSVDSNGGVPIASYEASCNGIVASSVTIIVRIQGLTNGVEYSCSVSVTNEAGLASGVSTSVSLTPEESMNGMPIWLLYEATKQGRK